MQTKVSGDTNLRLDIFFIITVRLHAQLASKSIIYSDSIRYYIIVPDTL